MVNNLPQGWKYYTVSRSQLLSFLRPEMRVVFRFYATKDALSSRKMMSLLFHFPW
jgi:hypothetical protein